MKLNTFSRGPWASTCIIASTGRCPMPPPWGSPLPLAPVGRLRRVSPLLLSLRRDLFSWAVLLVYFFGVY